MSSQKEYEAANVTPPLKNTSIMKCIAAVPFSPTNQVVNLTTLFGNYGEGHFITMKPDGGKCYVAFGGASGLIDTVATGVGSGVCWPLADGEALNYCPIGGKDNALGTGMATGTNYAFLHYRCPTGGATGFLRMYRSSTAQTQGSERFPAP